MDFPSLEKRTLEQWRKEKTFAASMKRREGAKPFIFYEGPPTANGRPGIHHVLVRSMKDAFLRYKTMQGFFVPRRAGWDTHGLPVELEVEKKLDISSKQEIEAYGVAKFNKKAKASVWQYKDEWEKLTERIGFWIDQSDPYVTYENAYIESVWGVLKHAWREKLLQEDFKVVPWCSRCGTALSSHEVAQGYREVDDTSVFVKFKLKGWKQTFVLGWTTTPWTLPGNVALAVDKKTTYLWVQPQGMQERYLLAKEAIPRVLGDTPYRIIQEFHGGALEGEAYEPLFVIPELQNAKSHRIYEGDFVTADEGTGVVHTAVMYGEDDYALGVAEGLPRVHTVDEEGKFLPLVPDGFAGRQVKHDDTEQAILAFLEKDNRLFKKESYRHEYPFCWRCDTPLLYYASKTWFVRMSKLKRKLLKENKRINWVPEHLKDGRFGEWLREVKDWALSRKRYWGTPLPVWRCEKDSSHIEVIGSKKELAERAALKNRYLLLRHGEAENNVAGIISSHPEKKPWGLTTKGRTQVAQAAAELRRDGVDVIIASDLQRTRETAEILERELGIKPIYDPRIRELNVGELNGQEAQAYHAFLGSPEAHWEKRPEGGENWRDLRKRMAAFMKDMEERYEGKTVVLVSHGDPLYILKGTMQGLSEEAFFEDGPYMSQEGRILYPQLGQMAELEGAALPFDDQGALDLHRPWIDEVTLFCKRCPKDARAAMHREEDVIDVWLDSGAMPFAARSPESSLKRPKPYPADFVCEGIDQTRGWFYTLLAVAAVMGKKRPYRNVVSTGHVLDKHGKKMSKSRGNTVNPWDMVEQYGADAVRWYFYTVNQPWSPKRFDEKDIKQARNQYVGTFLNMHRFFETYREDSSAAPMELREVAEHAAATALDRWAFSRLQAVVAHVREAMDDYDVTTATRALHAFVLDDLSNWYVRRSRSRLQHPETKEAHRIAAEALRLLLRETALLTAPFTPFAADKVFRAVAADASVHLKDFPDYDKKLRDEKLEEAMVAVRAAAAFGLSIRKRLKIPVRQPLGAFAVSASVPEELAPLLKEELNVKKVMPYAQAEPSWEKAGDEELSVALDTEMTPGLRLEGSMRELVRTIQAMRKDAGLTPGDTILLRLASKDPMFTRLLDRHADEMRETVRAKKIEHGPKRTRERFAIEKEMRFENLSIWIALRKA